MAAPITSGAALSLIAAAPTAIIAATGPSRRSRSISKTQPNRIARIQIGTSGLLEIIAETSHALKAPDSGAATRNQSAGRTTPPGDPPAPGAAKKPQERS